MSKTKTKIDNIIQEAKHKGYVKLPFGYEIEAELVPSEDGTSSFYWEFGVLYQGRYVLGTSDYRKVEDYLRYNCLA